MDNQENANQDNLSHRELKKQMRMEKRSQFGKMRAMRWGFGLLGVIILIFAVWMLASSRPSPEQARQDGVEISQTDHIKGNPEAPITLIEYSDFQCPACAAYQPVVKTLVEEFSEELVFAYRYFPLSTMFPFAQITARAAEAASRQGKFWEMHDLLFERQTEWAGSQNIEDTLLGYAELVGLDADKFISDLKSKEVADIVSRDYDSGIALGVNATPSFFLNGEKIVNPRGYEEFAQLIRDVAGSPAETNSLEE